MTSRAVLLPGYLATSFCQDLLGFPPRRLFGRHKAKYDLATLRNLDRPRARSCGALGGAAPVFTSDQAMSITLPNGEGRTSFAVFAKDRKKTLFGKFINVFGELAASPMWRYLPMLSLPAVGASTLSAVRSLVANQQARPEPAVDHDEHADGPRYHAIRRVERAGRAETGPRKRRPDPQGTIRRDQKSA